MADTLPGLLSNAIDNARKGRDSVIDYTFSTVHGNVCFMAEIVIAGGSIAFLDVCVYAELDPPGIPAGSITGVLRSELRTLFKSAKSLGFPHVTVSGTRVLHSSSAKVGKVVKIVR